MEIPRKTRSSRSPAPSWTRAKISLGRVTKRGGGGTRPRPIFARVQDGAGDRELRVFRGFPPIKTPSNRLQAG